MVYGRHSLNVAPDHLAEEAVTESFYTIPGAPYLALLSDLHNRDYRPAVKSLLKRQPELICVTGDLIVGTVPEHDESPLHTQPNALALLRECAKLAPTYVSLGNHEWMLDQKDLDDMRDTGRGKRSTCNFLDKSIKFQVSHLPSRAACDILSLL